MMEYPQDCDSPNCHELLSQLSDYVDGELDDALCIEIERHMAECDRCHIVIDTLRKTVELCRAYEPSAMPKPLTDRARAQLESAWRKMLAERKS